MFCKRKADALKIKENGNPNNIKVWGETTREPNYDSLGRDNKRA